MADVMVEIYGVKVRLVDEYMGTEPLLELATKAVYELQDAHRTIFNRGTDTKIEAPQLTTDEPTETT